MKLPIITLLLIAISLLSLGACHKDTKSSKTFVLVAGAWQGAYVWQSVKAQLESKGQKVIVVELPAHGSDTTSPALVSIDIYRDKVIDAINTVNDKVILVGHSMAGMVVTEIAEKIPEKIEKLVFIAAFVPANGQALLDLASTDSLSQLGPSLIPSANQLTLDVIPANRISIFCQDGSDSIKTLLLNNFRVEPAIPFANKVTITSVNFGAVDKYYIHTTQDHAISLNLQNRMVASANITKEYSLNTGHSPFLSAPDQVTNTLIDIMNQ